MGNILTDSNGKVLISDGHAFEVTSSIDTNIVPENIKKDVKILGVTGTFEGSGGSNAYIVNPLNGALIGSPTSLETITHQYQVSGGDIVECFLVICGYNGGGPEFRSTTMNQQGSRIIPYSDIENTSYGVECHISNTGLLTVIYNRTNVNKYDWSVDAPVMIGFKLNNNYTLYDTIKCYCAWSCLIKNTVITLSDKSTKLIQDITYDDELLVWNFDDGKYDKAKPIWIKNEETTNWYYKLTFSDGNTLCVTGTYPEAHSLFSVDDGQFIHANKLIGKRVYTLNGIQTLTNCEEIHENTEFYNIITDYHMNLFANDILTSTSLNNIYPIVDMRFVKTERETIVDYSQFDNKFIYGFRLHEQPTDVTEYCINCLNNIK